MSPESSQVPAQAPSVAPAALRESCRKPSNHVCKAGAELSGPLRFPRLRKAEEPVVVCGMLEGGGQETEEGEEGCVWLGRGGEGDGGQQWKGVLVEALVNSRPF